MNKPTKPLSRLEQRLMALLTHVPDPKFDLWQETDQGTIVGFYWESVGLCYNASHSPGWHYIVESEGEGEHAYIYEDDVVLVGTHNNPGASANAENN